MIHTTDGTINQPLQCLIFNNYLKTLTFDAYFETAKQSWMWEHIPVTPAVGRWKQEDQELKIRLCYITSLRLA